MMEKLIVKSSPHIYCKASTRKIMLHVVVALIPCIIGSVILFGIRSLRITAICVLFCVLSEIVYGLIAKTNILIDDFSAVLTGILLALNLPPNISVYACIIGCVSSIIIAKQLFGGIGQNFVNPALFGRTVMLICFPEQMTDWKSTAGAVDLLSGATPLENIASQNFSELPSTSELLLGIRGGCIGETCIVAIAVGFIYLLAVKVINPIITLSFLGSALILTLALGGTPIEIICGGICFGAVFMATDYVTSPISNIGKLIFGIGCGVLTVVLRKFASAPEGVSYAIMFMNLLVGYINRFTLAVPFGTGKAVSNG